MSKTWLRQGALIALTSVLLGHTASSAVSWQWPAPRSELLASAHPNEADPVVSDSTTYVGNLWGSGSQLESAALASADCPGCDGSAATLQVVYAHALRDVTLDNAANAWAQCSDCGATAVSVQVVVARRAQRVTANNRALSVNAKCKACHVKAAAVQLVVVDPEVPRLSKDDITALEQWMHDAVSAPAPQARLSRRVGTGSLEQLVNDALGSSTFLVDADRG